jgi:hypothetical protein
MAIPFADILQVRSVGVYMHFNHIVFYTERMYTERVNKDMT